MGLWMVFCAVFLGACGKDSVKGNEDAAVEPVETIVRVGPAGARIVTDDGAFELRIPAGALSSEVDITIRTLGAAAWPAETSTAPPVGSVYELLPDGLTFEQPIQVVHRTTAATLGGGSTGNLQAASHVSRSSAGALERAPTTTAYRRSGAAAIVGEIQHFSVHWATLETDLGALSLEVERDTSAERFVGEPFGVSGVTLLASAPGSHALDVVLGAHTLEPFILAPVVHETWAYSTGPGALADVLFAAFETELLPAAAGRSAEIPVTLEGQVPLPLEHSLPSFDCVAVGESLGFYEITVIGSALTVLVEEQASCVPAVIEVEPTSFATLVEPGAFQTFVAEPDWFHPFGLEVGNEHFAVVSSVDAAGIEVVDTLSGARYAGAEGGGRLYDVLAVRDGEMMEKFYTGSDTGVRSFELSTDMPIEGAHFHHVLKSPGVGIYGALDWTSYGELILASRQDVRWFDVLSTFHDEVGSISGGLFPGGTFPGTTGRAVLGPYDNYFAVFDDGSAYFGPWTVAAGDPVPATEIMLEPAPTSVGHLRCTDTPYGSRVCALSSPSDFRVYLFELSEWATPLATFTTVGKPLDPAVRFDAGSGDYHVAVPTTFATFELFSFDGETQSTLTPRRATGCTDAQHARFGAAYTVFASCKGSDNVVRINVPLEWVPQG
jgi:hypothetical protein